MKLHPVVIFAALLCASPLALSASADPSLGAHSLSVYHTEPRHGEAEGGIFSPSLITQASGSTVLTLVGRGHGEEFTANSGNPWKNVLSTAKPTVTTNDHGNGAATQVGVTHPYKTYTESGTALFSWNSLAGDASGQVFKAPTKFDDEISFAVVEIKNGGVIQDVKWAEDTVNPNVSPTVTTTGPATILCFWLGDFGDGPGTTVTAIPNNGFTTIDSNNDTYNSVQLFVAARTVATAGDYNITWNVTPAQSAQMWMVAVQAPEPTSIALCGAGVGAMALRRRRR